MDKMDDFIKKRLDDQTPAEDAWNIPSDDLWENAKVHFPKPKKKRRLLWIPMLLGLFLSTGLGFYFGQHSLIYKNTTIEIPNSNKQDTTIFEEKKNNLSKSNEIIYETPQESTIEAKENTQTPNKQISIIQPPKIISFASIMDNEIRRIASESEQSETINTSIPIEKLKTTKSEVDAINFSDQEEKITRENIEIPSPKLWSTETLPPLLLPMRLEEMMEESPIAALSNKVIPKTKMYHYPNQELGIGYSETPIRLLDIYGVQDTETGNVAEFDLNYKNINLHYTKWLKRRWSLSTGLYFAEFNLDINTSIFSKLTNEDIDTYFSQQLEDVIQLRQAFSSSLQAGDELRIELIAGEQLLLGDSINTITQSGFNSRILQIPAFVNYHIYKNKFEWIFSAGAALNIESFDQKATDIEIYKEGIRINEPTQLSSTLERTISSSLYGGVAMRYHINRKLNFGLSSKVDLNYLFLSNVEAGLYYRF